jgi:hypothetical protein
VGFLNPESAKTLLSKMLSEDGVPDGFRKGLWKVGAAKREAGKGLWSFQFATLRNVVKIQVLHARGAPANNARAHVIIPDDVQVQDFLDRCQEAGRQVLEKKIAALRTAGAGSLDLDTAQVDAVFASNCIDARIKTLQEKARLVNQQHQASQQQAVSGLQVALASAEVAMTASEKREGGGLKARGGGGKAKRPLDVTLTTGGEPTDIGRREEEQVLKDAIDATSAAEAAAHQSEGGAGEGRGKRVRKAPKLFGED